MAERRKINRRNNIRRRQRQEEEERLARQEEEERLARQEEEERLARQEEERVARQNIFRNDNRNLGFRRDIREIGGNPQRIRMPLRRDPTIPLPSAPPIREIAQDVADERRVVTAEYFGPGLSQAEYRRHGFQDLEDDEIVVNDLQHANFIEHISVDGERKLYNARNFSVDDYDSENLVEARHVTDESTIDPESEIRNQLDAMKTGGKYRFIYKRPDITTRTGGAFLWFLKEEFPYSLEKYGIYKRSEWDNLTDLEIFNSCLVHCFKDHPKYERVLYSKASIYTLCSKKVFEVICDMMETNVIVHKIKVVKKNSKQNGENYSEIRKFKYIGKNGKKYDEDFHICLMQGHYFPFVNDTGFTTKYIKDCIWKDEEKNLLKLKTKYGLYISKTNQLNSFNLIKLMIEQKEDYFKDFRSEILKEPRKEQIDQQIMFKDYEQFDVDFDSREWDGYVNEPDEFERTLENEEDIDEEELFNSYINNVELTREETNKMKEIEIFHGDIETRPNKEGRHIPYCMCYDNNEGTNKYHFWGDDCVRKCLNHFGKKRNKNKITFFKYQVLILLK